jgi:hypothetical protein
MKKVVLVFGLISGVISSAMMFLTLPLINRGVIHHDNGLIVGYTAILLSFVLVFFGIRKYRENAGGTISFGRGVAVGLLITLISCVFYVVSWEILYFNFMPDFLDKYTVWEIASLRAKGASEAAIVAKTAEMAQMKALYANPLINMAMTFIEPFPVGLVVTLVSAAILRRRTPVPPAVVAQAV